MFDTVNEEVTGRELLPQDQCGAPEEHLPSCKNTSIGVIERQRVVNNVIRSDRSKEMNTKRYQEEPATTEQYLLQDHCSIQCTRF